MTVQDYIDDIDITKPIDPPSAKTAPKPTSASVRANFSALKNAVQGLFDAISESPSSGLSYVPMTMLCIDERFMHMGDTEPYPKAVELADTFMLIGVTL